MGVVALMTDVSVSRVIITILDAFLQGIWKGHLIQEGVRRIP